MVQDDNNQVNAPNSSEESSESPEDARAKPNELVIGNTGVTHQDSWSVQANSERLSQEPTYQNDTMPEIYGFVEEKPSGDDHNSQPPWADIASASQQNLSTTLEMIWSVQVDQAAKIKEMEEQQREDAERHRAEMRRQEERYREELERQRQEYEDRIAREQQKFREAVDLLLEAAEQRARTQQEREDLLKGGLRRLAGTVLGHLGLAAEVLSRVVDYVLNLMHFKG